MSEERLRQASTALLVILVILFIHLTSLERAEKVMANDNFFKALKGPASLVERQGSRYSYVRGTWDSTFRNDSNTPTCPKEGHYPFPNFHGCCSEKEGNSYSLQFSSGLAVTAAMQHFLDAVTNRRVLFLGDSLTLQIFAGFLMIFESHGVTMIHQDGQPFETTRDVYFPRSNTTMQLLEFYRFGEVDMTGVKPEPYELILQGSVLKAALKQSDTVIANIGLHFHYDTAFQYKMMNYLQLLMDQESNQRNFCVLWRSTLLQHFATTDGSGLYEKLAPGRDDCPALTQRWRHPSDAALERVRAGSRTALIDLTSLLEGASAFHTLQLADCSHLCYSPNLFAPVLFLFGEAVQQSC